jgi:hypothetical protein
MKTKRLTKKQIKERLHKHNSSLNRSRHEELKKSKKKSKGFHVTATPSKSIIDLIVQRSI